MDVSDLLQTKGDGVVVIGPNEPVTRAAQVMMDNKIGAIVVVDELGQVVGIISERDIATAVSTQCNFLHLRKVEDLMTRRVVTCSQNDCVPEILLNMSSNHVRHIPVVENGKPIGMIGMRDIADFWLVAQEKEIVRLQNAAAV